MAEPVNHLKYFRIKLIEQLKQRRLFNLSRNLYFVCHKKMHISHNPLKKLSLTGPVTKVTQTDT